MNPELFDSVVPCAALIVFLGSCLGVVAGICVLEYKARLGARRGLPERFKGVKE